MMLNGRHNVNKITTNVSCSPAEMLTESTYLIKIEMIDGTFQLVHITKEQAIALGIEFPEPTTETNQNADVDVESVNTTLESVNTTLESVNTTLEKNTTLVQSNAASIAYNHQKLPATAQKTTYNYKVIQPEDLNLRPNIPVPSLALPRGRPKKRPPDEVVEQKPPPKVVKTARTRSGRITRPPVHMEKDFKKIVIEENTKDQHTINNKDLSTVEFQPLKTNSNNSQKPPDMAVEPQKKKKRSIPSQYRCSVCQKAYLGRNRMAQHLKKHPDHGVPSHLTTEDCEVWSFLIETALRAKEGHKGSKFCREMINLVKNARTLVKYFFKPAKEAKAEYKVDEFLAEVLNIKIEFFDDNFTNDIIKFDADTSRTKKVTDNILPPPGNELNCLEKNSIENHPTTIMGIEPSHKANVDLHFGSDIMDVIKENSSKSELKMFCEQNGANTNDKGTEFSNVIDCAKNTSEKGKSEFSFFRCTGDYISENKNGSNNDPINSLHNTNVATDPSLFHCTDMYVEKKSEPNKSNSTHKDYDIVNVISNHSELKNSDLSSLYDCPTIYDNNTKIDAKNASNNKILGKEAKNDFSNLFEGFYVNEHSNLNSVNVGKVISNGKDSNIDQPEKPKNFDLFDCTYIDKNIQSKSKCCKNSDIKNTDTFDAIESSTKNAKKDFDNLFDYTTGLNGKCKTAAVKVLENNDIEDHKILDSESKGSSFGDIFSCHKNYDMYLDDNRLKSPDGKRNSNDLNLVGKENGTGKMDFCATFHKGFESEPNKQGKEVDIFRNTIQNILSIGASDEHMINVLTTDGHKNEPVLAKVDEKSAKLVAPKSPFQTKHGEFAHQKVGVSKKIDDFDLNKLHLLPDELMLPVEGHVVLDMSTNSDDIMNVDQFVNERFKRLTEVDGELPNGTLGLDLPSLDCFNFHTD